MSFIHLYGRSGSGKTTLACTMTKLGHKVRIIDVDNKANDMVNLQPLIRSKQVVIQTMRTKLTEATLRDRITKTVHTPKGGFALAPPLKQPTGYLEFADIMDNLSKLKEEGKKDPDGCTVLVAPDSMTTLLEHLKRLILFLSKTGKFGFDEWAAWLSNLEEILHTLQNLLGMYEHVIVISHELVERDEDTGRIVGVFPFIEGSMRYKIGDYFSETYHTIVEVPKEGKPRYYVETRSVNKAEARTSRDLATFEESDFAVLFKEELTNHKPVRSMKGGKAG